MDESKNIENEKHAHQRPPLSWRRIAGEILAGTMTGFAAALPIAYVISNLGAHRGFFDWLARLPSSVSLVFCMVYGPGSAIGVYLVGRISKHAGSFLATLGWGCLGGFVMPLMLPIVNVPSRVLIVGVEQIVPWALLLLVLLIPPVAAAYGFNVGIPGTTTWFSHRKDRGKASHESTIAESEKQIHPKPPLTAARIAGEIVFGMATGFAVGLPVALGFLVLMGPIASAKGCFGGLAVLGGAVFLVFPVAYGSGSAIGVYLDGRRGKQTGSFLVTLACGFLGGLGAIAPLFSGPGVAVAGEARIVIAMSLLLIPPILATLGFNATRRYKEPPSS